MAHSSIWWMLAGGAAAVELVTGTFYLLMLGIGFVAAAITAHWGGPPPIQMAVAAVVGCGAVLVWRRSKMRHPAAAPAAANSDVNMDIGGVVHVEVWHADKTALVKYRGAQWTVALASSGAIEFDPTPGAYRIVEVVGSVLMVQKSD